MATILFSLPVKPGQVEALKAFAAECTGPRFKDFDASERRIRIHAEHWYLQQAPNGEQLLTITVTGPDLETSFAMFVNSQEPFDAWFKDRVRDLTGIDMNTGVPPQFLAATLLDYETDYVTAP